MAGSNNNRDLKDDDGIRLWVIAGALIVGSLVVFSLPSLPTVDIVRVTFNTSSTVNGTNGVRQLRFGVWSYCVERISTNNTPCDFLSPCDLQPHGPLRLCTPRKYQYEMSMIFPPEAIEAGYFGEAKISSTWTRALAAHAAAIAAFAVSVVLVCFSQSPWFITLVSFVSAMVGTVSNIAFYFHVQHIFYTFDALGAVTKSGSALWISPLYTFFILCELLLIVANAEEKERSLKSSGSVVWDRRPQGLFEKSPEDDQREPDSEVTDIIGDLFECQACWVARTELQALPCTHVFCERCIKQYFVPKSICFVCSSRWGQDDTHKVKVLT